MTIDLQNLRRWVIQQATELTFREKATGRAWKLASDGVVKYAQPPVWGSPSIETPEQILEIADEFVLVSRGNTQILSRSQLEVLLSGMLKKAIPSAAEASE